MSAIDKIRVAFKSFEDDLVKVSITDISPLGGGIYQVCLHLYSDVYPNEQALHHRIDGCSSVRFNGVNSYIVIMG